MKKCYFWKKCFNILFFYIKNFKNNKKSYINLYIFFLSLNAKRWHLDKFCYYWEIPTYSLIQVNVMWKSG